MQRRLGINQPFLRGYFVGYTSHTHRYRVYCPHTTRIYDRVSVYWNENEVCYPSPTAPTIVKSVQLGFEPDRVDLMPPSIQPIPVPKDTIVQPTVVPAPAPIPIDLDDDVLAVPESWEDLIPAVPPGNIRRSHIELPEPTPPLRRSDRIAAKPRRHYRVGMSRERIVNICGRIYAACTEDGAGIDVLPSLAEDIHLPRDLREAFAGPNGAEWRKAWNKELECLVKNRVFGACVPIAALKARGISPIPTMPVFKVKPAPDGSISRFKIREVAKGYFQKRFSHYDHTFAPTARGTTIRLIFSLAASMGLNLTNLDVETAFLAAKLDQELYVEVPEGMKHLYPPNSALRLMKAIYGLKQASRLFNMALHEHLVKIGFTRADSDPCFYSRHDPDGSVTFIALVVDDMIVAHSKPIAPLLKDMETRFAMKNLGDITYVLGMEVSRDWNTDSVYISQRLYIEKMLRRFNMDGPHVKMSKIPSPPDAKLSRSMMPDFCQDDWIDPVMCDSDDDCFGSDGRIRNEYTIPYRELVGSLLYAAICTRPDIAYAVGVLARYVSNPGKAHWKRGKQLLRYLAGTLDYKLRLGGTKEIFLYAFTDADWGGDDATVHDSHRSTSGGIAFLGLGPLFWASKLQRCVAKSTVDSEYRAMSELSDHILWLRSFLDEILQTQQEPTPILTDSRGALLSCYNPVNQNKLKHLERHLHSVRERTNRGEIVPVWIPGKMQVADIFTKSLAHPMFSHLRDVMFGLQKIELPADTRIHSKKYSCIAERRALKTLRRMLGLD